MNCPRCKNEMEIRKGSYKYRECGLDYVWLEDWPLSFCKKCGVDLPVRMPDPDATSKVIARALLCRKAKLGGDDIRYLRAVMGIKTEPLANLLGVNRVTVSRWENGKSVIEPFFDLRLRLITAEKVLPASWLKDVTHEILRNLRDAYEDRVIEETVKVVPERVLEASYA